MASKGDLAVSLSGLSDLAGDLRSIKTRMNDTGQVDRTLGHGEMGSSQALDALDGFMNGWRDGRKEIGGGIDTLAKMADGIVEQLVKTDQDLKNGLLKAEGGGKK